MPVEPVESSALMEQVGQPASAETAAAAGVNPMSWVTLMYEYSQGTTLHGLPYITRRARFLVRRSVRLNILTPSLRVTSTQDLHFVDNVVVL